MGENGMESNLIPLSRIESIEFHLVEWNGMGQNGMESSEMNGMELDGENRMESNLIPLSRIELN